MSLTEVYTVTRESRGKTASNSSLSAHACSPRPIQDIDDVPKVVDGRGDIELARLDAVQGASHSSDTISSKIVSPGSDLSRQSRKAHVQFATLCFTLFLAGWNDGTTGPLLPTIQSYYHVGYAVVSLIFILNCIGFVTAAAANVHLTDKFGFGKVMVLGSIAQCIGYALQAPAPPFPVIVLAYAINGFGIALQDAGANSFVVSLKDKPQVKMGILHSTYGAGALCAPLLATKFSSMEHWSYHYFTSLGISVVNTVLLVVVFRFKTQGECLTETGQAITHSTTANTEDNKYRQIFRLRDMHLLAFFVLIYIGVEVTLGGWTVTYIKVVRGGGHSSGYISSGFFGGLAFGRIALLWVNEKIGERRAVFLYAMLAICLELVVWLVPSLIGDAVAVSFIGMLLGPIYPIVMNHSARILPHWLLTGCIGWIAGFGQAGSAFLPFLTGVIASRAGIWALQPLIVAMLSFMLIIWSLTPSTARRID